MDNQQIKGCSFNVTDTSNLDCIPTLGNFASNGQMIDPQKSPFPSISRPSVHFATDISVDHKSSLNMEQPPTSIVQFEDQPSWLDDLLDEPDVPMNKSVHRRSRSDSVTYLDTDCRTKEDLFCPLNITPFPNFDFQKSNYYKDLLQSSANDPWKSSLSSSAVANGFAPQKEDIVFKISGLSLSQQQEQTVGSPVAGESATQSTENSYVGDESCQNNSPVASSSKAADTKRAKQHNARRSRVRKVQYIAELERSVQVLHAEGSLVSAELEFLDHQNLILSMENRALKQRLESLSQVQVIKSLEQEVLEREMVRLQYLHHQQNVCLQQQQQLPKHPMHRRVRSCNDFESQFANLSLRPKEAGSSSDGFHDSQHRV